MKCHVLAMRKSSRAGRTAVDSGGLHGIHKDIVRIFIPMDHCLPTLLVDEIGLLNFVLQYGTHEIRLADLFVYHTPFLAIKFDFSQRLAAAARGMCFCYSVAV